MLHIKLIYKSEAHSYSNTFFYKNQVYHTQILMGPQQTAEEKIPTILTGMLKEFDNVQHVKNLLPTCQCCTSTSAYIFEKATISNKTSYHSRQMFRLKMELCSIETNQVNTLTAMYISYHHFKKIKHGPTDIEIKIIIIHYYLHTWNNCNQNDYNCTLGI